MSETFAVFQITDAVWKLARSREPGVGPCPDIRVGITRASVTCGQCNLMWRSQEGEKVGDFEVVGFTLRVQCPSCHAVGRINLANLSSDE